MVPKWPHHSLHQKMEDQKCNFYTSISLHTYTEPYWVSACGAGSINEKILQD